VGWAAAVSPTPQLHNPRDPERTLLYQTVSGHFEPWLDLASADQPDGQGDHHSLKPVQPKRAAHYAFGT
jgi:hypothetical protein